jgi:predicted DNA-binding protein YlxM (UPF0122 family)
MDATRKSQIIHKLADNMQALAVAGVVRYGRQPRLITQKQEAVYRLCHHDFFGLSQEEAAEVLDVDQRTISDRLSRMKEIAPQLFPVLSKNVAAIYNRFVTDNMSVREVADDLCLSPRYCWRVLRNLWENREETGLYFRLGTGTRLHYRPWMDEHVKSSF